MPTRKNESDEYLQDKKIPELFQSLTIALLYNKPEDHVEYLIKCLDEVQQMPKGNRLLWDSFLPEDRSHSTMSKSDITPVPNIRGTMKPGARQ